MYSRGTNGGSGYMLGAESDIVMANFGRSISFGKNLTVGVTGSYMRTTSLLAAEFEYACSIDNVTYICLVPLNYTPVTEAQDTVEYKPRGSWAETSMYLRVSLAIDQSSNLQTSVPNTPLSTNADYSQRTVPSD
jgi:hypothetical protein